MGEKGEGQGWGEGVGWECEVVQGSLVEGK